MRRRLAVLVVAGAVVSATPVASPAATRPVSVATCRSATIGGQHRCIARGQYCARGHAGDYRRYGLSCTKQDARGRYHLQ